jgi:hypothetical protein
MRPFTIADGRFPSEELPSMPFASMLPTRARRRRIAAAIALLAVLLGCAAWSATAHAAPRLGFTSFTAGAFNADGTPATQAGAHPYEIRTSFTFSTAMQAPFADPVPAASIKDTTFDLPAGLVGDPSAMPQCRSEDLAIPGGHCPPNTQIGFADLDLKFTGRQQQHVPVYNMVPPAGQPAQFAFLVVAAVAHIDLNVATDGNYAVRASVHNINSSAPLFSVAVRLWGVPADPVHDVERFRISDTGGVPGDIDGNPIKVNLPVRPLLRNPTSCTGPVTTTLRATSYEEPDQVTTATAESPAVTGCDKVPFGPTASVTPDTRKAGASAGVGVDVAVPQNDDPAGIASADVKRVVMKLPAGMAINPSAGDGLDGCRDADFAIHSADADRCPNSAKIGTLTIVSPLLQRPMQGSVYLAAPLEQGPTAAAEGRMFRLFLTGEEAGARVKLAGSVVPDPLTGQLTATFDNAPQLPFSSLHLQFDGGERAPLTTPKACGLYSTHSELTSWASSTPVQRDGSFVVDQGCDRAGKFEPSMEAGLTNPVAGSSSPFTMTLSRPDGQQDIDGVDLTMPPGLLGNVGGVPQCPEPQATAGTCSSESQVGKVVVASGAGTSPLYLPQAGKTPTAVYLAGPYKGAPFSLSIVVPAQAGPFDLGAVVVRAALFVDNRDGHVTVKSDPLPTILDGIPLNVQKINVTLDRPGFMVSPTSCDPTAIAGDVRSVADTVAHVASRFQVGECASLALKPKLALTLSGKGQTTDGKHPAVTARLTQAPGQANLKKVRVALPLSLALDPDNSVSDDLCSFVEGSKPDPQCPKSSIVGTASAITPILDGPLSGPVYFVKNERTDPKSKRQIRTLPKLVIPLVGQNGVKLVLTGISDVVGDRLVTTFDNVPDAPVSSFTLKVNGGKKGILVVSGDKADICKSTQVADQQIDGQNRKTADADVLIQTPSCPVKVISKTVGARSVVLKVGGLGAGKVTVSGQGLKKTSRTIAQATVATITAARTKARLGKAKVSFTPSGAKQAKSATTVLR